MEDNIGDAKEKRMRMMIVLRMKKMMVMIMLCKKYGDDDNWRIIMVMQRIKYDESRYIFDNFDV